MLKRRKLERFAPLYIEHASEGRWRVKELERGGGEEWALTNIELIALILMFYVISLSLSLLEEISIFDNIGS
jgi:hypothetical protein